MLAMNMPIAFGDGVDVEQAAGVHIRPPRAQPLSVYATVDDGMGDMQAERPEFPRHALADHSQARLGGCELGIARFAAQAGGSAGKDHGATAEWREMTRGLAPDEEAAKAADAPELLELRGCQITKTDRAID